MGVHGNSGYLFEVDVSKKRLDLIDRITSTPSKRAGANDMFSYGYLGFAVSQRNVVYYLTGGPAGPDGRPASSADVRKGAARGEEHLHLVTYDLSSAKCVDHGPIFYGDRVGWPTYVNSIVLCDGYVYALGRRPDGVTDLFRIPDPHGQPEAQ